MTDVYNEPYYLNYNPHYVPYIGVWELDYAHRGIWNLLRNYATPTDVFQSIACNNDSTTSLSIHHKFILYLRHCNTSF